MVYQLRPVNLDFVSSAPVRLVFTGQVSAAPATVFTALRDDVESWSRWFTGVSYSRSTEGGAGREVRLAGGTRMRETVLAADPDERYVYRADECNRPGLHAQLEEWLLTPASGGGTRIQWTFTADASPMVCRVLRLAKPALGRCFRSSIRALNGRLATVH